MSAAPAAPFVLTLSCPDRLGIVAAVSQCLATSAMNIVESHQFGDRDTGRFFMRVSFLPQGNDGLDAFDARFSEVAKNFDMAWQTHELAAHPRVLIMVSAFDHCLVDLIYRTRTGSLKMNVVGVVSNHETGRAASEAAGLPYHHRPQDEATRAENEAWIADFVARENIELIILARYMQILSSDLVAGLEGRIINIHHSFLPSFKGAVPYRRAHERGVKIIGATTHFVTGDLDEGPIITQGVTDIRHDMGVEDLVDMGRDVERRTLARAIRLYIERRIILNGNKTVIFG